MKASELRPCDHCGKPIFKAGLIGYAVTVVPMTVDANAARGVMGMGMIGLNLGLAEAMAPDVDVIKEFPVEHQEKLQLCMRCAGGMDNENPVSLLGLIEARSDAKSAKV